eukprot:3468077-Pleurochrysis_carterae.AAC.1
MRARSVAFAARFARFAASLALRVSLLQRQASCCALLQHAHFEALPRPLVQQLPLLLAVCALAHPGCGA